MTRWERLLRWEEEHRFAVDATGTGILLLFVLVTATHITSAAGDPARSVVTLLVSLLIVAPLAWRRVRPTASAAAVYTAALLQLAFYTPLVVPADFAVLLALYSVTVHGPRWAHRVAIAGALVGCLLLGVAMNGWYNSAGASSTAVFTGVVALSVWAFGLVRRSRRETIEALVDRAERLEVERDQQSQIATAAERARIAREMHDIVAHSLTVMIAQADGGRYAADADPSAAPRALGTIAETGRAALTDMRRLLGVLRGSAEPIPSAGQVPAVPGPGGLRPAATQDFAPQPAESDIGALVEQMRASGLRASLVRMGEPRNLPPGAGLTVFRIAQESLTNVLKHAGPDPLVTVLVQWLPAAIVLEVSDDGRGASAASPDGLGQGLVGMRERAAMFGGSVSAGPRPGGGFRVRAQLPTPTDTAPSTASPDERTTPVPSTQDERR
ncbi:sensor histidine kinase [Cellulomonas fengjieae]|uniref:histidine kinase n=1 Tax=Cellulomonas fengjieae TaxID=2819978 RepID=A0ABS3SEA7_9CELL|nr:histidine kinase [Cellulomonas fengjieae]MBO3083819.1 sensor histidine kinase [Cellulomonas fengjieae]QVI64893.1 sensor histidine kinase [Cellulomonas fengjieae]